MKTIQTELTCTMSLQSKAVRQLRTGSRPRTVTNQDSVEPALSLVPNRFDMEGRRPGFVPGSSWRGNSKPDRFCF
jgi:hypothetical protein